MPVRENMTIYVDNLGPIKLEQILVESCDYQWYDEITHFFSLWQAYWRVHLIMSGTYQVSSDMPDTQLCF